MSRKIDWERQIGRQLKLRDLHVFSAVIQRGSMAKAAQQLGVSQPAVSEIIANLEHVLGVSLLERRPRGVEPTMYGQALLKRSVVAFDELKQGVRDIELLADPTAGEVKFGCTEPMAAILAPLIEQFSGRFPRTRLHVIQVNTRTLNTPTLELSGLRDRRYDFVLGHLITPLPDAHLIDDLKVEALFADRLFVVSRIRSPWARRRKIDLAELLDEPWIVAEPPDSWNYTVVSEACQARGLSLPKITVMTYSVHIRTNMVASGNFITTFPTSLLRFHADRRLLKVLPVDLPDRPWPVAIVTLNNRTLESGRRTLYLAFTRLRPTDARWRGSS